MSATRFLVALALLPAIASAQELRTATGSGASPLPCPAAPRAAVATEAPTPQEFTALVSSLVGSYGTRLGPGRSVIDSAAAREKDSSGIAGALFLSGAAAA